MTDLRWDHTIHYVNDLNAAIATFANHGLVAQLGGSHTEWGTYNALSYFGLSYIEFLSIEDPQQLAKSQDINLVCQDALRLLPKQQILNRLALRTNDINRIHKYLADKGLELSAILDGKRTDTNGRLIEWRMFTINGDIDGLAYPFIIQWSDNDQDRLAQLRQQKIDVQHPVGNITMQSAVFHVTDPERIAVAWCELFGLRHNQQDPTSIKIAGQQFHFNYGVEQRLVKLCFNIDTASLHDKIIKIGQGEYQFTYSAPIY